jgi:hypothetical protein
MYIRIKDYLPDANISPEVQVRVDDNFNPKDKYTLDWLEYLVLLWNSREK